MPCQCGTMQDVGTDPQATAGGCQCATESGAACECGSSPTVSEREASLERVVMELDKRLRKLESSR